MKMKFALMILAAFVLHASAFAGRPTDVYDIKVSPSSGSWTAAVGEKVKFDIVVTESNVPVKAGVIKYEIGADLMEPAISGETKLKIGRAVVDGGTMKVPGFLRCKATYDNGTKYTAMGTIGFEPEKIKAVTEFPSDFEQYWKSNVEQARKTELTPRVTLIPEKCTDKALAYQVSFCCGSPQRRFYAMLAVPKAAGQYPAVVRFPGAGVYAIDAPTGLAEQGVIAMAFGIHGIPNNLDAGIYRDLDGGALRAYPTMNLHDREQYYYKNVILGAVRALDYVQTLPEFNGKLAVFGGSQGGFLAIAAAALHDDVQFVVANFPAMSDLAGYAHGRAGGWPHIFKSEANRTAEIMNNMSYFDTVNFARLVKAPGYYALGFNDLTCAPTTTYAVYNAIAAPKTLYVAPLAGHYTLSEQSAAENAALLEALGCK